MLDDLIDIVIKDTNKSPSEAIEWLHEFALELIIYPKHNIGKTLLKKIKERSIEERVCPYCFENLIEERGYDNTLFCPRCGRKFLNLI